jgi:vancomycin permeability regulator SanA
VPGVAGVAGVAGVLGAFGVSGEAFMAVREVLATRGAVLDVQIAKHRPITT